MTYKAIIFDLDGTAIPNALHALPNQAVIDAVTAAKPHIKLCAATGRSFALAGPILHALDLDQPCVLSAGTQIVNPRTGKVLWEVTIPPAVVRQVYDIFSPFPYTVWTRDERPEAGKPAAQHTITDNINVVYIKAVSQADAAIMLEQLEAIPDITASHVGSWTNASVDIHVTHKEATKEHAVAELLRILNIPQDEVIGVGDGNNDIHLFKAVGHRVAMGNASDLLKSQADEVCDSVDKDGLAAVIRKYAGASGL